MPKKIVYRSEDIVRIVNPQFVTRVGYPWDKKYVRENVMPIQTERKVRELLDLAGVSSYTYGVIGKESPLYINAVEKILDELAYAKLKTDGFGGTTRKIYTRPWDECKDKLAEVVSKRIVKTGVYTFGSWYDSIDDGDYCPPYLSDEKSNVLLTVRVFSDDARWSVLTSDLESSFEIEECNVAPHTIQNRWRGIFYKRNGPLQRLPDYVSPTRQDAVDYYNRYCSVIKKEGDTIKVERL